MIPTLTPWRLAVHVSYWISLTGGASKKKHAQSTLISAMWLATYSLLYHMVLDWRPVFPLRETSLAGDSLKPLVRWFGKKLLLGSLLKPITEYLQAIVQLSIPQKLRMTLNWRNKLRKGNCAEWPWSTTFWKCGRAAKIYVLHRRNCALKTSKQLP